MLTTKHLPRPSNMLLKDYLRDDLSSCSSSGFKSFPRRQCCSTVRFDIQAKRNPGLLIPPTTTKPPRSSSTLSALHKASQAVIKAVRLLPFPSNNKKTRLLSKTLSRKVLSRRFWRKAVKEEQKEKEIPSRRWRSFRDLLLEDADHKPPDQHAQSESSNIKSHHNSWGSSEEFTWSSTENDTVGSKENTIRNKTAVKAADEDPADAASTLQKAMDWGSEEKEQFSPVSVLECPFDDEDISSPEGSKHKVIMKKSRHFDGIANSVKPVELEERMASEAVVEEEEEVWRVVDEVIRSSSVPTSSKCLGDDAMQS
ncbi:uncharacterized protein G2W53_019486 [Senna tora]|uniref:Uncharacterized protein n=1 Tax=Senna tora TaxID=362788 RepID=A0A834WMD6_9FABA|nr:uncharacterized protein G2W53_019486 [Senna tora]